MTLDQFVKVKIANRAVGEKRYRLGDTLRPEDVEIVIKSIRGLFA